MRRVTPRAGVAPALLLLGLLTATLSTRAFADTPPLGFAEITGSSGQLVGVASFQRVADGVEIRARFQALPPGVHGYHVHAVGKCEAPTFVTAGDHFNPTPMEGLALNELPPPKEHGLLNPRGPHPGDLPNLVVGEDGTASMTTIVKGATLAPGNFSLFDGDGTSLVIHEREDDQVSDPAGNSGGRIACGVLGAGPAHDLNGHMFVNQPLDAQRTFRSAWGPYAPEQWALERDVYIIAQRATQVAGVQAEPPAPQAEPEPADED